MLTIAGGILLACAILYFGAIALVFISGALGETVAGIARGVEWVKGRVERG